MNKKRLINLFGIVALVIVLFASPSLINNHYWLSVLALVIINILLVSSIRTVTLIGHLSLCQVGFAAVGAYGAALLVMEMGLSFWVALIIASLMAGLLAMALGYPFLKVKGMYFAILTLLASESIRNTIFFWTDLTEGPKGLTGIPAPEPIVIGGRVLMDFYIVDNYLYIILVVVLISLFILYKLEHSHLNTRWSAIKDSEALARSAGINVSWYKVLNFAIAGFFAGITGALFAFFQHNLSADIGSRFGALTSMYMLVYLVVGGESKFAGPILGTLFMMLVAELARPFKEYQVMLVGALTIVFVIFIPDGLYGLPRMLKLLFSKKLKTKAIKG